MRYFLGLLAAIALIALGVILFTGGSKKPGNPSTPSVTTQPKTLPDYADTDAVVRFTVDGVINGDQAHRTIRITVGRDQRLLEVIQGYSGNVIQSNPDYNTKDAYGAFLSAINNAGFARQRKTKNTDEAGVCPLGHRLNFEIIENGNTVQNLWSTTCGSLGTFDGNKVNLQVLFQRQIINYDKLTRQVDLFGI
jgi:hypothetical protein